MTPPPARPIPERILPGSAVIDEPIPAIFDSIVLMKFSTSETMPSQMVAMAERTALKPATASDLTVDHAVLSQPRTVLTMFSHPLTSVCHQLVNQELIWFHTVLMSVQIWFHAVLNHVSSVVIVFSHA